MTVSISSIPQSLTIPASPQSGSGPVVSTGPEPDYGNVFDDGGYVPPAPVIPDISGLLNDDPNVPNPYVDTFTTAFPTVYGTPYEDEITSPFYDPWAFEDRRGGRR